MTKTGIFFHYQQGERLRDFPQALAGLLQKDNVFLYDALYPFKPVSAYELELLPIDALDEVHSPDMVRQIQETAAFEGALVSASGTVAAALRISQGEIDSAFVFTGYGDHHAGRDFFGGGCYFNGAAIAVSEVRRHFALRRFAVIDTDAHHGDGSWDIFGKDPEVMYMCLCSGGEMEQNNNFDVPVPFRLDDAAYLQSFRENFSPRVTDFRPEMIFWNWGYDGTQGDYGDMGLTPNVHTELAREIKRMAQAVCGGRLVVVLCGGSRRDLARQLIPGIVGVLADEV